MMLKNIIVLIFIFAVYANTVTFAFNAGMGNFGKRQIDKVRRVFHVEVLRDFQIKNKNF